MGRREAILTGTQAARRLHLELGTRREVEGGDCSRAEVFQAIDQLGALLLFRPLDGLLGAYFGKPGFERAGIIVTTQRDLHVQRFTAAHELGHLYLGHEVSLDDEVGLWRGGSPELQEVEADAFASEFLLPRWLYVHHCGRQRWESSELRNPEICYQLSLRLGASYDATCWGLLSHKILDSGAVDRLRKSKPKALKLSALAGEADLDDPWADVWIITEQDDGLMFEGGPDDIVVFRCSERASAGYLWDEGALRDQGFEILSDRREASSNEECGGAATRILTTRATAAADYRVSFAERRPWLPDEAIARLTVDFALHGKERGLPRFSRNPTIAA